MSNYEQAAEMGSGELIPYPIQADQSLPTNLSNRDAVRLLADEIFGLIFESGGFEEMTDSAGFGFAAKAAKPIIMKKAKASIASISDEQAAWLIDRIHALSASLENLTGSYSAHHYGEEKEAA